MKPAIRLSMPLLTDSNALSILAVSAFAIFAMSGLLWKNFSAQLLTARARKRLPISMWSWHNCAL